MNEIGGSASTDKYNYANIYKNFIRDIRKFYIDKFKIFKNDQKCSFVFRNPVLKNKFLPF